MGEITSAEEVSNAVLSEAMADAFSDYALPVHVDEAGFTFMMRQRGLDRRASRVAFENGTVAAIWLVSIRGDRSYLISSGTRPAFRSRGLARAMASSCLEGLQARQVAHFQTEVLRVNETAAALYRSLGMGVMRELDCFVIDTCLAAGADPLPVEPVQWSRIAAAVPALRDWQPSWQNDDPSIAAMGRDVLCLASFDGRGLAGYSVANPASGTMFQMAVRQDMRRQGIGRAHLRRLQQDLPGQPLRFINLQQDDRGFRAFLLACAARETPGQFELAMAI